MKDRESIFQVIPYKPEYHEKSGLPYPTFMVYSKGSVYLNTIDEVERYIQKDARPYNESYLDIYAYVVIEYPVGMELKLDQNLSIRIYLQDGRLWATKDYEEMDNNWGLGNRFRGREPEEIKFKPGDIVEILGCPGNKSWTPEEVNLAIIVNTPPTTKEVAEMRKLHDENYCCDYYMDTYRVLSLVCDELDHAPTISVFEPIKEVPSKQREELMKLYEEYLNKNKDR